jgi:tetratricopeptide (TPR) repeat protein
MVKTSCPFLICVAVLAAQTVPTTPQESNFRASTARPTAPPAPLTAEMRGDIFMARKMYREAVETYNEGNSNSAVLVNKIGIAYHQQLQLDRARKHYERAIKMSPNYSEAINNLGTIYYAKKSYRKAIKYYKKALVVSPNSASIHSNLGTAYFARKKYQDAFNSYQKAVELDPEVFEHRGSNGVLLQERSVAERAKFHFFLAKTYAKAGNVERALQYMRKAIEEGFKERNKFMEESEFVPMRELPEFQQLMTMEVRVL